MSLLSTSEFADFVGLSAAEIRALITSGTLTATVCAGRYVIDTDVVEAKNPRLWSRLIEARDDDEDQDLDDDEEGDEDEDDEDEDGEDDEEDSEE